MRKILDEILWSIYYRTERRIGGYGDYRFIILNDVVRDIHNFTAKQLNSAVRDLSKQKFIEEKNNYEDSVLVSLTEKGILRAISYKFRRLNDKTNNKKEEWDGKWRMVTFDIPNTYRKGRNTFVYRLKMGGFYKLQESIFLYPYNCKKEIDAFVKLFKLEKYVRFGLLDFIDNQDRLKIRFGIE